MRNFQESVSSKALSVAIYLILTAAIIIAILIMCDGHFIYAMDDPYIGLAQAEHIVQGNYGINNGETTAPCSSVLWPFLITIGAGTPVHQLVPLVLNLLFGSLSVWFIGLIVEDCPWSSANHRNYIRQVVVTILLTFAGNLISLVFLGMEHSLQVLMAVICAYGMLKAWAGEKMPTYCLAAAVLAPAIRYEMFAIVFAVALTLIGQGRWKASLVVTLASMVLPGALGLFLMSHGLPALPNSVLAKTGAYQGPSIGLVNWLENNWDIIYAERYEGPRITEAIFISVLFWLAWRAKAQQRWMLGGACLALVLHFFLGKFGWLHRYEIFAILFGVLILFRVIAPIVGRDFFSGCVLLALIAQTYFLATWTIPRACQNIYDQQYQMHRFVTDYYKKNVAVNDLGWVSYERGPGIYILDLYGLASNEALRVPIRNGPWLSKITREHQVGLVIIYPNWFWSTPNDWVPVAALWLTAPKVSPASNLVVFYCTPDGDLDEIHSELVAFAPSLPPHAFLQILR